MGKGKREKKKPLTPFELAKAGEPSMNAAFEGLFKDFFKDIKFEGEDDQPTGDTAHYAISCVVISVAYLEQMLATLLSQFFIEGETSAAMLHINGALGSLKAKSDLAYCLGLIPKAAYQMLIVLGEIRNTFAHSHLALSFDSDEAKSLIEHELVVPPEIPFGYDRITRKVDIWYVRQGHSTTREKFYSAVCLLSNVLHALIGTTNDGKYAEPRRQRFPDDKPVKP